ncbi:hypothetical protein MINTMi27_15060 [Mycobacterium intracellulare]|uniref:glutaredoxin domain-containing protein n=1 Tax=Mycobacterium intracellulare TaxID=1767 RepID=UPI00192791E3|nr:glutaredoxin domain-containing protein [Mycobacterium intracellulare]BCP41413.1 hypothetical protein MINTMi27_15060 [Mycobacterium intracellulare]
MTSVVVYTRPLCQPCKATKRKMDQLGIPYREVELNDETRRYVTSLGYDQAPVITVDYGEGVTTSWSNYRPDLIQQLKETLSDTESD